jgi:hypothetical protein
MEQKEFNAFVEKTAKELLKACENTDRRFLFIATDEKNQALLSTRGSINGLADTIVNATLNNPDFSRAAGIAFGELVRLTFSKQPGTNDFPAPNNNLPN